MGFHVVVLLLFGSSSGINAILSELKDGSLPSNSYACSLMASVEMCSLRIGTYPVGKSKPRPLAEWDVSVFLTGALAPKRRKKGEEVKGQCCCHSHNSCHCQAGGKMPCVSQRNVLDHLYVLQMVREQRNKGIFGGEKAFQQMRMRTHRNTHETNYL